MRWLACFLLLQIVATASLAAVDANTASRAELETVRGIGPATSQRIVEERRRRPFRDTAEIAARVKGIGEAKLRKMTAAGLTVGGNGVVSRIADARAAQCTPEAAPLEVARVETLQGAGALPAQCPKPHRPADGVAQAPLLVRPGAAAQATHGPARAGTRRAAANAR